MSPRLAGTVVLLLAAAAAPAARAQWTASLAIDAFPSPYLSDWEANPTIGTLTITNPTGADQSVQFVYRVTDQAGRVIASGRSDPQTIPAGAPTVITDFVNVSGSSQHDQGFEDQMRRTGRLPEGDHTACAAVTDLGGFVLAEDCASFTIIYPDPPYLIGPLHDEMLTSGRPVFQWTPLQVPPAFQLTYVLRIAEVLGGQAPEQALVANIPLFETAAIGTNLEYPIGAPSLEEGKSYVWRVQALDQNGYAASANEGRSETWTFRLGDPGGGGPVGGGIAVTLDVTNNNDDEGSTGEEGGENEEGGETGGGAQSNPAPSDSGFTGICDTITWSALAPSNQHSRLRLALALSSPVGFSPREVGPAQLFLHRDKASRQWAVLRNTGTHLLMAYGDCDGWVANATPWVRWLGIRTVAGATATGWLMGDSAVGITGGDSTVVAGIEDSSSSAGLEFGIVVFTLENVKVGAPTGFEVVNWFLEGNQFSAKPGVNLFGILQLEERNFWGYFQAMGYHDKEIALQGFVGIGNKFSAGFGVGSAGVSGEGSVELEFLNLRAVLPSRRPVIPFVRRLVDSMHLEFEFAWTRKEGVSRVVGSAPGDTTKFSSERHLVFTARHRMTLTDSLAEWMGVKKGAALVGSLALDIGKDLGTGATEWKLISRYQLDAMWPIGETKFVVGGLQLEVNVVVSGKKYGDVSFTLSGAGGWGAEKQLARIAFTLTRSDAVARSHTSTASLDRLQGDAARWRERLKFTEGELAKATTSADSLKLEGYIADYEEWIADAEDEIAGRESTIKTRQARQQQQGVVSSLPSCGVGKFKLTGWSCGLKVSLGNLSIVDLGLLVREVFAK